MENYTLEEQTSYNSIKRASISFGKCKTKVSEKHNQRLMHVPDAREDLLDNNDQLVLMSISDCIREDYKILNKKSAKKLGSRKDIIIEAVAIIKEDTTIEQMLSFAQKMRQICGIRLIQCYLHKDEGHYDVIDNSWIPNYHAHLIFSRVCRDHLMMKYGFSDRQFDMYGKLCNINLSMKKQAQDLIAEATGLARGLHNSTRRHLSVIRYKSEKAVEEAQRITLHIDRLQSRLRSLESNLENVSTKASIQLQKAREAVERTTESINRIRNPELLPIPMHSCNTYTIDTIKGQDLQDPIEKQTALLNRSLKALESSLSVAEDDIALRNDRLRQKEKILSNGMISDLVERAYSSLGLSESYNTLLMTGRQMEREIERQKALIDSLTHENNIKNRTIEDQRHQCTILKNDNIGIRRKIALVEAYIDELTDDKKQTLSEYGVLQSLSRHLGIDIKGYNHEPHITNPGERLQIE